MVIRWAFVIIGQLMIGAAAGAMIVNNYGADPYSVLIDGAAELLSVPHIIASLLCAITCVIIGKILGGKVRLITVVAPVCASLALMIGTQAPLGVASVGIAGILYLVGLTVYLSAGLGAGSVEFIAESLAANSNRFGLYLNLTLLLYCALGVAAGGSAGAFTIVIALVAGPCSQLGRKRLIKYIDERLWK